MSGVLTSDHMRSSHWLLHTLLSSDTKHAIPQRPFLSLNLPHAIPTMSDSERYIPPPPPYELALQHDQKVTEAQALDLEVSKGGPFRDDEKDQALSVKDLKDVPTHPLSSITKYLPRQASGNLRAPRPLPSRPADTRLRGQGYKLEPVAETKSFAAQNDFATEPQALPPPSFSAIGRTLDEAFYLQSMHHPSPSVRHSTFHYPSQSSYGAPRRESDDRWRVSAYSATEPYAEMSFRRSSQPSVQSPSYSAPQSNGNPGAHLLFDPSVAYSDSQANSRTASAAQREMAASLYSSAVSPHLRPSSAVTSGSHQYSFATRVVEYPDIASRQD
ncbi:hypothetical protein L210DRAFT_2377597 [Boletus edulis BED1]|uniref:Uncharacterized protein n=1 Tax=Boletus edulis BED1 TaxID=1328754 RepID=A0AAD4GK51_BOLED|nr:hypothetical protein L210DRAFT_2377597 [Boletus edulis BED1]